MFAFMFLDSFQPLLIFDIVYDELFFLLQPKQWKRSLALLKRVLKHGPLASVRVPNLGPTHIKGP